MLSLSWRTIRTRWSAFVGSFLALCLGVCLLATTGLTLAGTSATPGPPVWYAGTDLVVVGSDRLTVPFGIGPELRTERRDLRESAPVPADVPGRLAGVPGIVEVVPDRWVPVDLDGWSGPARPWSSAALRPYPLVAGTGPTAADQVVLTSPTDRRPGDRLVAQTPVGPRELTVAGVVAAGGPGAVYLGDTVLADWAGDRVDAVGLRVAAGADVPAVGARIRAAVPGLRVLGGERRQAAEPDPDARWLADAVSLLGMTATVAVFVSIFVVAGTFSFAVAQRRREFALLRTTGATPRQVRRLVLGEALVVGVLAGLAGCLCAAVTAPPFAGWLVRVGFAPPGFTARFSLWPLLAAVGAGLLVALLGVGVAARRAARIRPIEALREASVDARTMTPGRWIFGLVFLGGSGAVLAAVPAVGSADGLALTLMVALLALVAATLLAPVAVPVLVRLLGWPLRGTSGQLARFHAMRAVRRSTATTAPILITVGIAATVLAATATLGENERGAVRDRITATTLVSATGPAGLADQTVAALRRVPGVRAAVPVRQTQLYVGSGDSLGEFPARYVGPGVERVLRLPTLAGSVADLTVDGNHPPEAGPGGDPAVHASGTGGTPDVGADAIGTATVAVSRSTGWRVGTELRAWLADGTAVRLRVVAVLADSLDLDGSLLLPWELAAHDGPRRGAEAVYLAGGAHSDLSPVAAAGGGRLVGIDEHLAAEAARQDRGNRLGLLAVLGMALLYTGLSIANTLVMATAGRAPELAVLRLAGATPRQVLRMIGLEAFLVGLLGVTLAAIVTAVMLAGLRAGLADLVAAPRVAVPWLPIGTVAVCCVAVAVTASLGSAALALRTPAVRLAGVRE